MTIRRVFLVGFMGAGKSTVGPLLAGRLGWAFLDLDQEIEKKHGMPIRKIFEERGENGFRALEHAALEALVSNLDCVVALGGGAFILNENRELVRRLGFSVFLDCSLEVLLSRCPADGSRPLLRDRSNTEWLYQKRLPYYLESDFRIDVSNLTPDQVCDMIAARVSK